MRYRFLILTCALAVEIALLMPMPRAGPAKSSLAKRTTEAKTWIVPRTPDGQPDLQGIWSNATLTPLERPPELAGKQFLTEEEGAEYEKRVLQNNNADRRDKDSE